MAHKKRAGDKRTDGVEHEVVFKGPNKWDLICVGLGDRRYHHHPPISFCLSTDQSRTEIDFRVHGIFRVDVPSNGHEKVNDEGHWWSIIGMAIPTNDERRPYWATVWYSTQKREDGWLRELNEKEIVAIALLMRGSPFA